jgi:chaperonin GroES
MAIKIEPLDDHLVVKPFYKDEMTAGGVALPEKLRQKQLEGEVLAVGPGNLSDSGQRIPLAVKEGDIIIYTKFSGTEIEVDNEKLLILKATDLLAKINENQ